MSGRCYTDSMDTSLSFFDPDQQLAGGNGRRPAAPHRQRRRPSAISLCRILHGDHPQPLHTGRPIYRRSAAFCTWCEERHLQLERTQRGFTSPSISRRWARRSASPTVKQHLSAISKLFDFLVTGHIVTVNPAHSVTAPRYQGQPGQDADPQRRRGPLFARLHRYDQDGGAARQGDYRADGLQLCPRGCRAAHECG